MFPHFPKLHVSPHHEDFVVQHDVRRRDKPISLYRWLRISQMCIEALFLLYSQKTILWIFQLFQKTGQYQIYYPHFPLGALDEDVFLCNRCEEGGILGLHNSPFLAPSQYTDASQRTDREARRLKMGSIWFSSDCEHNLTRAQRALQATSFASSRPCEVTNEATSSHQQITHDTIIHTFTFLARSAFWNGVSLPNWIRDKNVFFF